MVLEQLSAAIRLLSSPHSFRNSQKIVGKISYKKFDILLTAFAVIFFIFASSSIIPSAFALTTLSSCQSLNINNEVYQFSQDIQTDQACLIATAQNITINGAGFHLYFNTTPTAPAFALDFESSNNSHIYNLTILGSGENTSGILFNASANESFFNATLVNFTQSIVGSATNNVTIANITSKNATAQSTITLSWANASILKIKNLTGPGQDQETILLQNVSDANIDLINTTTSPYPSGISVFQSARINISRVFGDSNAPTITLNQTTLARLSNLSVGGLILEAVQTTTVNNASILNPGGSLFLINVSNSLFRLISIFNGQINFWPRFSEPMINVTLVNITSSSNPTLSLQTITPTEYLTGDLTIINTSIDSYSLTNYGFIPLHLRMSNLFGGINFSQGINGTGNFTRDVQIKNGSITINALFPYNQTPQASNISFTALSTNYSVQRLLRNGSICFAPQCTLLSSLDQPIVSFQVNDSGNYSLVDIGSNPPATVSQLTAVVIDNNDILWNWTNPSDIDFNGTLLYLNGTSIANLSKGTHSFNTSNLTDNTAYVLSVHTIDFDGNINSADTTNSSVSATTLLDTIPPGTVANLSVTYIDRDQLNYNWTLPTDPDFSYLIASLNGAALFNLSKTTTNLTLRGLSPNTTYTFTLSSVDVNGNQNATSNISTTTDDTISGPFITQCGTIRTSGSYIISAPLLVANLTCFYIKASNVIIDGNGSTILFATANLTSPFASNPSNPSNSYPALFPAHGIFLSNVTNISIANFIIATNATPNMSAIALNATATFGLFALTANQSSTLFFTNISTSNETTGINLTNATAVRIANSTIAAKTLAISISDGSQNIIITNTTLTNATSGMFADLSSQLSLIADTLDNITQLFINNTVQATSLTITNTTMIVPLPSGSTNSFTTLFDASNVTTVNNLTLQLGAITLTNVSAHDLDGYTIQADVDGNLTIISKNISAVSFPVPLGGLTDFDLTKTITQTAQNTVTDTTAYPQLSAVPAVIIYYNVNEGAPVYIIRNTVPCTTVTATLCYAFTSLSGPTAVFNTSDINGTYTLQGFTLHLISPENDATLNSTAVTFRFSIAPTFNTTITGCNLSLDDGGGSSIIREYDLGSLASPFTFSYSTSNIADQTNYTWAVICNDFTPLDNSTAAVSGSSFFTVSLPAASTTSDSSSGGGDAASAFGAYPGALSPWIDVVIQDKYEMAAPLAVKLHILDGVRLRVNNEVHHVGLVALDADSATINVSSNDQQATLAINETKLFIIDENGTTALSITLNGVGPDYANLTITPVPVAPKAAATGIAVNGASGANAADGSSSGAGASSDYTAAGVKSAASGFKLTQGLLFIVVIAGIILVCGLGYYFLLIVKYRKAAAQPSPDAPTKQAGGGGFAKFLSLFAKPKTNKPTAEQIRQQQWQQQNQKQPQTAQTQQQLQQGMQRQMSFTTTLSPQQQAQLSAADRRRIENSTKYMASVLPILSPAHTLHVAKRLAAGSTPQYIEFELIQNGYTHEQAKQVMQYYALDKFVEERFLAGASAKQVEQELTAAGWSNAIIEKMFKKDK